MRILLVSHAKNNPEQGSSRVYYLLEEGLSARGHTVKTLHYEDLKIPGFAEKIITRLFLPQAASRRASKEQMHDYDVVMSSSGMLYPLFKKLKKQTQRPLLVSHLHGSSFFDLQADVNEAMRGHRSLSWISRFVTAPLRIHWDESASRYADLTITQNGSDMDLLSEKGTDPLLLIPLTVHPEIFAAATSTLPPEAKDPLSLMWFGGWSRRKGSAYIPRAFKLISERYPQAKLSLLGTGMAPEALLKEFDPALWSRLTIFPSISRAALIEEFGRQSIILFPSLGEGFGLALLEAMSMGLAAVTTYAGLGADWLRDRDNAMIVPTASAYHLAEATMTLIEDKELRCRVARNGQELARLLTFDRLIDSYEAAFQRYALTA